MLIFYQNLEGDLFCYYDSEIQKLPVFFLFHLSWIINDTRMKMESLMSHLPVCDKEICSIQPKQTKKPLHIHVKYNFQNNYFSLRQVTQTSQKFTVVFRFPFGSLAYIFVTHSPVCSQHCPCTQWLSAWVSQTCPDSLLERQEHWLQHSRLDIIWEERNANNAIGPSVWIDGKTDSTKWGWSSSEARHLVTSKMAQWVQTLAPKPDNLS